MINLYIEDKNYEGVDFNVVALDKGEYEGCTFSNCDLSSFNLEQFIFSNCEFIECNISMALLSETAWRDVAFKNCKMLGLDFENCNQFGFAVDFEACVLNDSIFYKRKMRSTRFKDTQLKGVDFAECDLSESVFDNCDMTGASFDNSNLEKVDFTTAINFAIDPAVNRIKKARFSSGNLAGLLAQYDIKIEG